MISATYAPYKILYFIKIPITSHPLNNQRHPYFLQTINKIIKSNRKCIISIIQLNLFQILSQDYTCHRNIKTVPEYTKQNNRNIRRFSGFNVFIFVCSTGVIISSRHQATGSLFSYLHVRNI